MTDLTPYYWAVIYRSPAHPDGPLISLPMREPSAEAASDRALSSRQTSEVLSVAGPFGTPAEAEAYRLSWMRDQRATGQDPRTIARQRTIADLLDKSASVIHTNELHDRPDRTPAQNAALPPAVSLYGAFNSVICGNPDDTRGDRDGVNSADLVRTFAAFLAVRSPLEWSQAPERTHAEIMNALRSCAAVLRNAADQGESAIVGGAFTGPRVLVHVGDVLKHRDMERTLTVVSRKADGRGFMLASDPEVGTPFPWDDYELPGNADSPFTLVECPHLGNGAESMADDPADAEEIETGPGFPVACSSMHEHHPENCAPEAPVTEATTATETGSRGIVWAVTGEVFKEVGTPGPVIPETFVRVDDIAALITVHRAAGASVEVSFPFGSDGTGIPTYVHVYVGDAGTITYRRTNPGESDL